MKIRSEFNSFNKIKSIKTKNALRAVIGSRDPKQVIKTLTRIKNSCSESDYINSTEALRNNFLFKDNGVLRSFISSSPVQMLQLEVVHPKVILSNLERNSDILTGVLHDYCQVLELIKNERLEEVCVLINTLMDDEKYSLFLVRVLFFIKNSIDGLLDQENILTKIDNILFKAKLDNIKNVELVIKELSNPRTDYFNIYKRVEATNRKSALNNIIKSFVFHIPKSVDEFEKTLSSFYSFSLIDTFLYLASVSRSSNYLPIDKTEINNELIQAFNLLSNIKISESSIIYRNNEIENFFRQTFLLIELNECFKYKTVHYALYNRNPNKFFELTEFEKSQISYYFSEVHDLKDLSYKENENLNIDQYSSKDSSLLENSTALVNLINKMNGDISGQEELFVKLMSSTKDIGFICPGEYLQMIESSAKTDELRLVSACLISIANQTDLAEHSLRRVIQEITIKKFESLLDLIKYINDISSSVTEHLIDICDETFISKLFNLTDKPIAAIEERANILDWYGNKYKDLSIIERAKNLRIDVQISKQKETIDDARIYVEPTKFTKWVGEHFLNKITIQLEDSDFYFDNTTPAIDWEKVSTGFSSKDLVGSYLLSCYSEFCSNNLFGIASYLGRRIRHGTIEGTAIAEVESIKKQERFKRLFLIKRFEDEFNNWFSSYEEMLESLKTNYLHINSRKFPDGWLHPSFNTQPKVITANNMFKDVCNSFFVHQYAAGIPYIITDYCWRCVEEDLKLIRKNLGEFRSRYGTFGFDSSGLDKSDKKLAQDFCHEVNAITTDKFRTIVSWFNKPSIASPSANLVLLFKAVISEVKDRVGGFNPLLKVDIDESRFTLSGGLYFAIYDALNILVFNAAKHGSERGKVEFLVDDSFSTSSIKISLVSQVCTSDELELVKARIARCFEKNFEDAHVVEGESGIKKLRQMEDEGYISDVKYEFSNVEKEVIASFVFDVSY
ncbi:hypothetical protein [Thiomicrospira sp.]|uniref:hypothetical protein n=1 Tax=Thiomicrospira sp. TaxID=935 RepID=UPI002F92A523